MSLFFIWNLFEIYYYQPSQIHLMVQQLPSRGLTGEEKVKHAFFFFTDTSEAMVLLHTHFALLYLRGGLCWDWGLGCRRSTAIFTSENKSIQTLNRTVTCRSANVVDHAKSSSRINIFTIQMKREDPNLKIRNGRKIKMQQIELPDLSIGV